MWPNAKVIQSRASLFSVLDLLDRWGDLMRRKEFRSNDELQDYITNTQTQLGRLVVIRSTGFLEVVIEEALYEYAEKHHHPGISEYIRSTINRGAKADDKRIKDFVSKLCKEHLDEITNLLENNDTPHASNIKSLISYRNLIAHGSSENVSPSKAITLSKSAIEIGDYLIHAFDP